MTEEAIRCFIAHPGMGGVAIRIIPRLDYPAPDARRQRLDRGRKVGFQKYTIRREALFGTARPLAAYSDQVY